MTPAGDYNRPFQLLKEGQTPDTTGQAVESFPANITLMGALDLDDATNEEAYGSAMQSICTGTVRFRGYPAISQLDRLLDTRFNETYKIDGVRRGNLEMICSITRYQALDNVADQ